MSVAQAMTPNPDTRGGELERRLFDLAADPLVVTDADGRIVRANRAACVLAGRPPHALIGEPFVALVHPSDHAAVAAQREHLGRSGPAAAPKRLRILRPDGGCRWIEAVVTPEPETGLRFVVARDITGRESVELERLTALFDHAPLGMALMAPDGALQRVNGTLARMLESPEGDLLDRTIFDLLDDEDSAATLRLALTTRSHAAFQVEIRLRGAGGRAVVALFSATEVTGLREQPLHYVCQVLDITERAEAQERLEMNEAKLAEAQQIARLGSWEWEIAADRVSWSEELYRIYGVRPDRFTGSYGSSLDRVHPDDRARVGRVIENAVAERRSWSLDYRIVRPDGELRMIHARGEVVCDEEGDPVVVQGTCQDVTESRRVEDALRAAEQLFRRAFDDAPIGMALIDLEGRWLRLNRAICRMFGRSERELRTMRLAELAHPEDRRLDRPLIK
jgi:PAS domain S-box-containing protein